MVGERTGMTSKVLRKGVVGHGHEFMHEQERDIDVAHYGFLDDGALKVKVAVNLVETRRG